MRLPLKCDRPLAVDEAQERQSPAWSCRNRIRRRCPASRLPAGRASASTTGRHVVDHAAEHALLDRETDREFFGPQQFRRVGRQRLDRVPFGLRRQQMPGIGMLRLVEDLGGVALFDDLALLHDGNAAARTSAPRPDHG